MNPTLAERKLRELVLAKGGRDKLISARDEEDLLRLAISELNMPFSRAEGIVFAVAENSDIEIETDINRTVEAMVAALASPTGSITSGDFELVVKYMSDKLRISKTTARSRVKALVIDKNISPARSGLLQTTLWFRQIE